jgi:hypothetical protein
MEDGGLWRSSKALMFSRLSGTTYLRFARVGLGLTRVSHRPQRRMTAKITTVQAKGIEAA